jgi:hypothetical protein
MALGVYKDHSTPSIDWAHFVWPSLATLVDIQTFLWILLRAGSLIRFNERIAKGCCVYIIDTSCYNHHLKLNFYTKQPQQQQHYHATPLFD